MFSAKFVRDAAERAAKSGVQAGVAYLGVVGESSWNMDFKGLVLAVVGGVMLSLASSLVSSRVGSKDSASAAA